MTSARPTRLPRANFATISLPEIRLKNLDVWRVHDPRFPALQFRTIPGHRFSHPDSPTALLYLGCEIETCLWEAFGDTLLDQDRLVSASRWKNTQLTRIRSDAVFRICDLTNEKSRLRLGMDLSALMPSDLTCPHAWGLAIQTHPATLDGLRYLSRFNGKPCLALFERPGTAKSLTEKSLGLLPDLEEANRFLHERSIRLV